MQKLSVVAAYGLVMQMTKYTKQMMANNEVSNWSCIDSFQEGMFHEALACAFMFIRHGLTGLTVDISAAIMREMHTVACCMLNTVVLCFCKEEGRLFKCDLFLTPSEKELKEWGEIPEWHPRSSFDPPGHIRHMDEGCFEGMREQMTNLAFYLREVYERYQGEKLDLDVQVTQMMTSCFISAAMDYPMEQVESLRWGPERYYPVTYWPVGVPDQVYLTDHHIFEPAVRRLANLYIPIHQHTSHTSAIDEASLPQLIDPYIYVELKSMFGKACSAMEIASGMLRTQMSQPFMEATLSSLSRSPNCLTTLPHDILQKVGETLLGCALHKFGSGHPANWKSESAWAKEIDWILQPSQRVPGSCVFPKCPWHAIHKHVELGKGELEAIMRNVSL